MKLFERLHMFHRLLRYRYRSERAEMRFLLGRDYRNGTLLDVGAHRGIYSYWMHRWFRDDVRIVAFEPQPELVEFLGDFKRAFRLDRMMVEPVGLSSQTKTLRMQRSPVHWGGATVAEYREDRVPESFDIRVTTIDEYLASRPELRPIRFIKCDVECHEADVFAGAEAMLHEDRPEILVEWASPDHAEREKLYLQMQRLDYSIFQFECGRLVPCPSCEERYSPSSWQLSNNYVFLPRERAARAAVA